MGSLRACLQPHPQRPLESPGTGRRSEELGWRAAAQGPGRSPGEWSRRDWIGRLAGGSGAAWGGSIWHMPLCPRDSLLQAVSHPGPGAVPRASCSLPCLGLTSQGPSWWCLGTPGRGTGCRASAPPHGAPGLVWADPRCDARPSVPGCPVRRKLPFSCQVSGLFAAATGTAPCLGFLDGG